MRISDWSSDVCSSDLLEAKVSAVGDFVTIVVVQADSCAGIARQAEQQPIATLGCGIGERFGNEPHLARGLGDPAVLDPAAIRIAIEEPAREQRQREDVDRENTRRERNPDRPADRKSTSLNSSP